MQSRLYRGRCINRIVKLEQEHVLIKGDNRDYTETVDEKDIVGKIDMKETLKETETLKESEESETPTDSLHVNWTDYAALLCMLLVVAVWIFTSSSDPSYTTAISNGIINGTPISTIP